MLAREGTPWVKSRTRRRSLSLSAGSESLISHAGAALLLETASVSGLRRELRRALEPWELARAQHHPGQVVLDLAVAVALGGDCLSDLDVVRSQPGLFGEVASEATVSRTIARLAADADAVLEAIAQARAAARAQVWSLRPAVPADGPVIVDIDATLLIAHSEKERATPTYKRTFGFHPMLTFVDHGREGTGEPLSALLREGRATANDAADQIAAIDAAVAQLPESDRARVLVRGDTGSGVHRVVEHIVSRGWQFSVGLYAHDYLADTVLDLPEDAWEPAVDVDGEPREGADVAELTAHLPKLRNPWPAGTRIIARREFPHPGAQLRLTDVEGRRIQLFATNTVGSTLPELELRHRMRARAEDRIRGLKDTGLRNLPLHGFDANRIWIEIVLLAAELLVWTQHLALHTSLARYWEPKRLRHRLLAVAGRLVRTGRREHLRLPRGWPELKLLLVGHARLRALH